MCVYCKWRNANLRSLLLLVTPIRLVMIVSPFFSLCCRRRLSRLGSYPKWPGQGPKKGPRVAPCVGKLIKIGQHSPSVRLVTYVTLQLIVRPGLVLETPSRPRPRPPSPCAKAEPPGPGLRRCGKGGWMIYWLISIGKSR